MDVQNKPERSDHLGGLWSVVNVWSMAYLPFLRCGFGREGLGLPALLAMVAMIALSAEAKGMGWYILAWLFAVICRRIESVRFKGIRHSRCAGYPQIALWLPFVNGDEAATGFFEPCLCFLVGIGLMPLSEGLGAFIWLGTFVLLVRNGLEREFMRKRVERMQDAQIEGECYAEQMERR